MSGLTSGFVIYENEKENIIILRRKLYGREILDLEVDGAMETMMYLDEKKRNDLIFPYMTHFSYAFAWNPDLSSTYLIGGGGFAYPRYYLSHYPEKKIHVAEYSQSIVDVSKDYFYLNELLESPNFRLSVADGFSLLEQENEIYDVIINDAFTGSRSEGRNEEVMRSISSHLSHHGIYMENMIGIPAGLRSFSTTKYVRLVKKYFKYTKLIVAEDDRSKFESQNLVLVASNEELL